MITTAHNSAVSGIQKFRPEFQLENRQEKKPLGRPRITWILGELGYEHLKRVEVVRDCFDTECVARLKLLHQTPKKLLRLFSRSFCFDAHNYTAGSLCATGNLRRTFRSALS
jgi:hypothetical protein